jgi:hypothetical protein
MSAASVLDAARDYVCRGWFVVPIHARDKKPVGESWQKSRLTEEDLPRYFSNGNGVGVLLGVSNGLVDVDIDAPEALPLADIYIPHTNLVSGHKSKPRSHRFFRCPVIGKIEQFKDLNGESLIELRSNGGQTVLPPSTHPSGEPCIWYEQGQAADADGDDLLRRVRTVSAGTLLARHWPSKGSRHSAALALSGMLLRANWSEEDAATFVVAVAEAASDEEARDRTNDVRTTATRIRDGQPITGASELAKLVGDPVLDKVREWLSLARVIAPSEWPDPSPLGDELPPVQAFTPELLPQSFLPLIEDTSERMQTPMDYAAASVIVALAGCVNRRATMQPKAEDTAWLVVPNLWGAIIAPPGFMKSPVQRQMTRPLSMIEEEWRDEFQKEEESYDLEKKQSELKWQAYSEQYKKSFKNGTPQPAPPAKCQKSPRQKRLVLTSATFEKLHEILKENPAGVLVLRDELTGWLAELDKLGREGERAFYLQAWNGDTGFSVDRIGRGSIYVSAACVSVLGNIQPSRLRSYLSDAVKGGPNDDGLFQRFQILVWPDPPRDWKLIDRPPNNYAEATAAKVFSALANLSPESPVRMRFDGDAQQLFFEWLSDLERKVRAEGGLHPAMIAHLSKYRSLMPSLAALFELADKAAAGSELTGHITVSVEHAKQAAALCEYLESHAHRVYACVVSPECRAARELARHIRSGDLSDPFKTRDVYLRGWSGLDNPERVRGALELLEEAAWVRREETSKSQIGGRPSETWRINPKAVPRA